VLPLQDAPFFAQMNVMRVWPFHWLMEVWISAFEDWIRIPKVLVSKVSHWNYERLQGSKGHDRNLDVDDRFCNQSRYRG